MPYFNTPQKQCKEFYKTNASTKQPSARTPETADSQVFCFFSKNVKSLINITKATSKKLNATIHWYDAPANVNEPKILPIIVTTYISHLNTTSPNPKGLKIAPKIENENIIMNAMLAIGIARMFATIEKIERFLKQSASVGIVPIVAESAIAKALESLLWKTQENHLSKVFESKIIPRTAPKLSLKPAE